jgi:hypothetical protein
MLFSNERKLTLSIPAKDNHGASTNVGYLVDYLCENAMKDPRKELFVLDGTVYVITLGAAMQITNSIKATGDLGAHQRCRLGARGRGKVRGAGRRQRLVCVYFARRVIVQRVLDTD